MVWVPPPEVTLLSSELGSNEGLLGNTLVKGIPLVWFEDWVRYPAPVQMSGEELGINTHRVFSLFKCLVISDLTPTPMLEKVGRGVEEVEEAEKVWELHPLLLRYLICFQHRFSNLSLANSPLASNFTSVPLFSLCFSGFLAKSFFKSESLWLPLSTSTLRALRVDVAIPLLIDEVVSVSFSPVLLESFTGLPLFNLWVGSKEEDVSIPITIQRRSVNQGIDLDSWFLIFFHRISSFNGSTSSRICMIHWIRNNKAEGVLHTPPLPCIAVPFPNFCLMFLVVRGI